MRVVFGFLISLREGGASSGLSDKAKSAGVILDVVLASKSFGGTVIVRCINHASSRALDI